MNNTHSAGVGYILWLFGFMGAHRFYFGKNWTGLLWALTGGLCGIGWIIDLFLIADIDREADSDYSQGRLDYTIIWILCTFLGYFGVHRMAMGKWFSGLLYLFTGGFFLFGWLYDFMTLNEQIDEIHRYEKLENSR